jgi:hypothetical protein
VGGSAGYDIVGEPAGGAGKDGELVTDVVQAVYAVIRSKRCAGVHEVTGAQINCSGGPVRDRVELIHKIHPDEGDPIDVAVAA